MMQLKSEGKAFPSWDDLGDISMKGWVLTHLTCLWFGILY